MMPNFSDARYLESKKTVDDRALNQRVLASLRNELASRAESAIAVLEVGAGIGTMATRLIDWQVLSIFPLLKIVKSVLELAFLIEFNINSFISSLENLELNLLTPL